MTLGTQKYLHVFTTHHDSAAHRRRLAQAVNQALGGANNTVGTVTLALSTTTTTVTTAHMADDKVPILVPLDANAAAETWHISARSEGSFEITHANAGTTRQFAYVIVG